MGVRCIFSPQSKGMHKMSVGSESEALFSCKKFCKLFSDSPSHQIFRRMYGVLNIDKNKN